MIITTPIIQNANRVIRYIFVVGRLHLSPLFHYTVCVVAFGMMRRFVCCFYYKEAYSG